MEDLIGDITRGNVTEVKVVLASVVMALACYQLVLIAVGYGKVRPSFLGARPAALAHRAVGDAIVVMVVVVALMCLSYFGFGEDRTLHVVAATALLVVLALKIAVVRWWHGLGRPAALPRRVGVRPAGRHMADLGRGLPGGSMTAQTRQLIGSVLVAAAIVAVAIVAVTARLGTTSVAELEAQEDRQKARIEQREEAREERQKLREERLKRGGG